MTISQKEEGDHMHFTHRGMHRTRSPVRRIVVMLLTELKHKNYDNPTNSAPDGGRVNATTDTTSCADG